MVGIGAVIPSRKNDIQLGDIVVRTRSSENPSVRQYYFGKATVPLSNEWLSEPSSPCPPQRSRYQRPTRGLSEETKGWLKRDESPVTSIKVQNQENFDNYSEGNEEIRLERSDEEPCVHSGGIVSGNFVIRNAVMRDLLAQSCLCFEMKTAGLMNYSPCLVIWGIWDFCGMHKNDRWQKYAAAAAAAAYAKGLLGVMDADISEVKKEKRAREILDYLQELATKTNVIEIHTKSLVNDRMHEKLLKWLSSLNSSWHPECQKKRVDGTST
ncbi:hypothetical protein PAAG_08090 [Paracoccidioides lutzii Pb01]|uniref:Nucleoside phosphorylase domain-containing protein n=1 Tax=Paracoccidioides lutzii (strain ATCC MYA-826 / Pb01) TaxID=502779 RepID=C1HBE9_PARBA|nr:hypothetical protein PAAG_08090 [Paracoccidioides lutzii Pb01]EEH37672.2 hypothetical protein PAAG_08090 [Paracoccidioides lutzii Pb01]